jgi:putative zinc finger/helix-turn-helix YgiT family protein
MDCVVCGGVATQVTGNRIGRYRGERVEVQSEFFRCEDCKEEFFNPTQMKSHNRAVKNEIRKKYGLLSPERIAAIRAKLELSQPDLEELLGVGSKVVVRWESGKVIQGSGQDNILRLLEQDPSMLKTLREIQKFRAAEQEKYRKSNPRGMVAQAL